MLEQAGCFASPDDISSLYELSSDSDVKACTALHDGVKDSVRRRVWDLQQPVSVPHLITAEAAGTCRSCSSLQLLQVMVGSCLLGNSGAPGCADGL